MDAKYRIEDIVISMNDLKDVLNQIKQKGERKNEKNYNNHGKPEYDVDADQRDGGGHVEPV